MSTIEASIDIDRALDSALADVGEAFQFRRKAAGDAGLRRALRGFLESAGETPPDATAAARCATATFILGQDEKVGDYADKADSHRMLYLWGMSELFRDRPLQATEVLRACVEKEPRDQRARLQLAPLLALLGQSDQAREVLGDMASQTDRAQVLYVLGTIAEADGDYGEARDQYQAAIMQDPEHVDSLFRLAYQHDLAGDDDAAIALYERARRVKPARVNVLLNLGVLYEDREEYAKARECYQAVLHRFPNHTRAKNFMRDAESSLSMIVDEDMELSLIHI